MFEHGETPDLVAPMLPQEKETKTVSDWIMKRQALWGVLILFALAMLILHDQQQSKQRAIDARCSTSYAGQTEKLSQLAARPDFFQQLNEAIWRASNCQQKAPK